MKCGSRGRALLVAPAAAFILAPSVLAVPALGSGAAVHHCSSARLRLKFVDMEAATGHRFIDYAFMNVGAPKCSLRGYPSAVLLNKTGHVIHSAKAKVGHWGLSKVRTTVIGHRKRAFFSFTWTNGDFCLGHSFTFYGLRVFPPENVTGFRWHFGKTSTCDNSAMVSAVRPKVLV